MFEFLTHVQQNRNTLYASTKNLNIENALQLVYDCQPLNKHVKHNEKCNSTNKIKQKYSS